MVVVSVAHQAGGGWPDLKVSSFRRVEVGCDLPIFVRRFCLPDYPIHVCRHLDRFNTNWGLSCQFLDCVDGCLFWFLIEVWSYNLVIIVHVSLFHCLWFLIKVWSMDRSVQIWWCPKQSWFTQNTPFISKETWDQTLEVLAKMDDFIFQTFDPLSTSQLYNISLF